MGSATMMMASVIGAMALSSTTSATTYRLALFGESLTTNPFCGLYDIGQTARYFTVEPTPTCTMIAGSEYAFDDGTPQYYLWSQSPTKPCFKAGCDEKCDKCTVEQGSCSGGSGSGSGGPTTRPKDVMEDAEAIMSDELLTCGGSVSGDSSFPGLSLMGNPTPDRLHTIQVDSSTTIHLDGCGADFDTVLNVFSTDEASPETLLTCKGCEDCSVTLEAGEYALLVEGDESAVKTSGSFNINMDCGSKRRARSSPLPVLTSSSDPAQMEVCYSFKNNESNTFTYFFLFEMNDVTKEQQVCVLERNQARTHNNTVKLEWKGENATCHDRSDEGSVIIATVVDDKGECEPSLLGDHLYQQISRGEGNDYDVKFNCVGGKCTNISCPIDEVNVKAGSCIETFEVFQAYEFGTCSSAPGTSVAPGTTVAPPVPQQGGKKSSPVGAIVGSLFGAIAVGGIIFFVIKRRKKKSQESAYAILQDEPAF